VLEVTDRVYRLGTDWVGWYLLVDDDAVTVVDCGFPGYHDQLPEALAELGRPLDSVAAIVLTHYHSDHVGSAERIRAETGATVFVPAADAEGLRSGKVPPPNGLMTSVWRPRMLRYMAHAGRNGGAKLKPVTEFQTYEDGDVLDAAGGLRAIHTPGHTGGHSSLLAESAGVLFAGDALGNVSLLNGAPGVQVLPFHEDAARARESIARLEPLAATTVVFGHGEPFKGSPAEAVAAGRAGAG
jgi:glyoxylase-like metal-dependent hydrolase (beta-lactamase superfamily II)